MKMLFFLLWLWFIPSLALGAVAYDNANSTGGNTVTTLTISSFTVGATNPLILCAIGKDDNTGAGVTVSVTFNGVGFTQVGTELTVGANNALQLWRLVGQSGTFNVVATFTGAIDNTVIGCISFTGVDQTTPIGTRQDSTDWGGAPISLTIPTNGMGANFVAAITAAVGCSDMVAVGGHTERFDGCDGPAGSATELAGATSTATGSLQWSGEGDAWALQVGVPINAATATTTIHRHRVLILQ